MDRSRARQREVAVHKSDHARPAALEIAATRLSDDALGTFSRDPERCIRGLTGL
jgi:hypothetical protein